MAEVHDFDAGDLGCGTGLPREFLNQIRAIPVGHHMRAIVSDPAGREDLPSLARMMGHSVVSVETADDGRLLITVERVK